MRSALPLTAALVFGLTTAAAADEGVRTAAHARPLLPSSTSADLTPLSAGLVRPNGRVVPPTPLSRRGTLFGSVYHGDNEPVNPNSLRHAAPSRSRRKAITW